MDVNCNHSIQPATGSETKPVEKTQSLAMNDPTITSMNANEMKQAIDEATGLMQVIRSDKLSEDIIRKMPADEYIEMLTLLDDIISGSIDEKI